MPFGINSLWRLIDAIWNHIHYFAKLDMYKKNYLSAVYSVEELMNEEFKSLCGMSKNNFCSL